MPKLIALVATALIIDGVRTIIQPGQELPDLSPHDERELTASGAAENPDDKAAQVAAARRHVQQEQASTATAEPDAKAKAAARK